MIGSRDSTYKIDPSNLSPYGKSLLDNYAFNVAKVKQGDVIVAGYYEIPSDDVSFMFELTHDLVFAGAINPAEVTKDNEQILKLFLQPGYVGKVIPAGTHILTSLDTSGKVQKCYAVTTLSSVAIRKNSYDEIVCDVVKDKESLGEGSFGTVHSLHGSLKYRFRSSSRELQFESDQQQRAIKIGVNTARPDVDYVDAVQLEQRLMSHCPHLSVRPSLFGKSLDGKTLSAISMRKLKGNELFDLLADDLKLSVDDRFQLSIELLRQLGCQVHKNKLMHRDIKPENIMVYEITTDKSQSNRWQINIIDFNLSQKIGIKDRKQCGTADYVAPELEFGDLDEKSDIFSMALVIALIWRDKRQMNVMAMNAQEILEYRFAVDWEIKFDMFDSISDLQLSAERRKEIIALLTKLTAHDKNKRPDVEECISELEKIYLSHKLAAMPLDSRDNAIMGYDLAVIARGRLAKHAGNMFDELSISLLQQELINQVNKLPDDVYAVREFVATLGVKCFYGIQRREIMKEKIKEVSEQFKSAYSHTEQLRQQLHGILHDIGLEDNGLTDDQARKVRELGQYVHQAMLFVEKVSKSPLDLDEVAVQTERLQKKNSKIESAMVYFNELKSDREQSNRTYKRM